MLSNIQNDKEYPRHRPANDDSDPENDPKIPSTIVRGTKLFFITIDNCDTEHLVADTLRYYNQCKYLSDREIKFGQIFEMCGFSKYVGRFIYIGAIEKTTPGFGGHLW